jgi:hypothetical protein
MLKGARAEAGRHAVRKEQIPIVEDDPDMSDLLVSSATAAG